MNKQSHVIEIIVVLGLAFGVLMGVLAYTNPSIVPKIGESQLTSTNANTSLISVSPTALVQLPTVIPTQVLAEVPALPNFGFDSSAAPNASIYSVDAIKKFIVAYASDNGGFGISSTGGFSTVDPEVVVPVINGGVIMPPCEKGVNTVVTGYRFSISQPHPGLDTSCGLNEVGRSLYDVPIVAPFPAVVVGSGYIDEKIDRMAIDLWVSGFTVILKSILANPDGSNPAEYMWLCGHMTGQDMPDVGTFVNSGQIIGRQGSTGNSTGPHCHQALWKDGKFIDPETVNLTGIRTEKPQIYGGASCSFSKEELREKARALALELGIPARVQLALWESESNFSHCWEGTEFIKINELGAIGVGQIYLAVHSHLNPNLVLYDVDSHMQDADGIFLQKYEVCGATYEGEERWFCAVALYKGITQSDYRNHRDFQIFLDKYYEES